jgi:hypothetical protein
VSLKIETHHGIDSYIFLENMMILHYPTIQVHAINKVVRFTSHILNEERLVGKREKKERRKCFGHA